MQLPTPKVLLLQYHTAIQEALADATVPVYLDTSVLMWSLKVGKEAREQFLDWCRNSLDNRVYIPTWAAHELYRHIRESTIPNDAKTKVRAYQKGMSDLLKYVSVAADDSSSVKAGYPTKADLVRSIREQALSLIQTLSVLTADKKPYEEAVDSIIKFVNERIIHSDVFSVLDIIAGTYEVRFSGRVPPGFKDETKKENDFGDLVFWREIIEHLKAAGFTGTAIIITNDNKADWHHKPWTLADYAGTGKGEHSSVGFEAKIPHPLLQHEARLAGLQDIIIINMPILSVVLARPDRTKFGALTSATHPPGIPKDELGINWPMIDPSSRGVAPPPPPSHVRVSGGQVEDLKISDLAATVTIPEAILPFLPSLNASPEERAAAVAGLYEPSLMPEFSLLILVDIGRRLYRVAAAYPNESSVLIMDIFRAEFAQENDRASAIALGMFLELYYDEALRLRPTPVSGAAEALFSLQTDSRVQQAIQKINTMLASHRDNLLYIPSTKQAGLKLKLRMDIPPGSNMNRLDSIVLGGRELIADATPGGPNSLTHLLGGTSATVQQLIALISQRFVVPHALISVDKELTSTVTWLEEKGLGLLRTDQGGVVDEISALCFED